MHLYAAMLLRVLIQNATAISMRNVAEYRHLMQMSSNTNAKTFRLRFALMAGSLMFFARNNLE